MSKGSKLILSAVSIGILILIVILLPKSKADTEELRTNVRYVPAPTTTPSPGEYGTKIPQVVLPKGF